MIDWRVLICHTMDTVELKFFCKMENKGDLAAAVWFICEIFSVIIIIIFSVIIRANK